MPAVHESKVTTKPDWLVIAYTLPPEPSRLRVSIWRRLRKVGAVYLEEGVWVLPKTEALEAEVRAILKDIENFKGTFSAFVGLDLETGQADRLRSRFLAARDEEYAELQGQCRRFMVHIDHATSTERYTFAEVEELEEELAKLERWLEEIRSRDPFNSPQWAVSAAAIEEGRQALAQFTERAFAESGDARDVSPQPVDDLSNLRP
jgi:hypothetical protein